MDETLDQLDKDDKLAKSLIKLHREGKLKERYLIEELKEIYGPWDVITRCTKYFQIEAALNKHICEFWIECEKECTYDLENEKHEKYTKYRPLT